MDVRWLGLVGVLACAACAACAAAAGEQQPVARPRAEPAPSAREAPAPRAKSTVSIRGIEGSMSSYDVRTTMEARGSELAACQEPSVRAVPVMAGTVEFAIQVDRTGKVGEVLVRASDLGDRVLERCVSDVILQTPFPTPNGGDARITWTMILEPAHAGAAPELWEQEQVAEVIDKHLEALQTECAIPSHSKTFDVIAYVNRRGRVASAGVRAKSAAPEEVLDCIVAELRTWPMPKPKQSRFAKVSFKLASVGPRPPRPGERRHGKGQGAVSPRARPPRRR